MIAFKKFKSNDIIVTPFTVNKSFTFYGDSEFTASNVGIDRLVGVNTSTLFDPINDSTTGILPTSNYSYGPYQRSVYDTMYQLYYSNFTNSSLGSGSYDNSLQSDLIPSRSFPEYEGAQVVVLSIPQKLFGNYIQPGSFLLTSSNLTAITDDGEGNLISNTYIGNIIYNEGVVTIFSPFAADSSGENSTFTFTRTGVSVSSLISMLALYSSIGPNLTKYYSWGSEFGLLSIIDDDNLISEAAPLPSAGNDETFTYNGSAPGILRYIIRGRLKIGNIIGSQPDATLSLNSKVQVGGVTNAQASSNGAFQFVAGGVGDTFNFEYISDYFEVAPGNAVSINLGITNKSQGVTVDVAPVSLTYPLDTLTVEGEETALINAITGSDTTMSFQSALDIYETQYKCTIESDEFNYSLNPTLLSESISSSILLSGSNIYVDFATGSEFNPFVTAIGLYDDNNELLAVGKLSQPLPTSQTTDTTILINLDR
jgi:hypothetical protein